MRVWVHCPRASNGLLPPRSNLVGYMRWHTRSDSWGFSLLQTIIPTAFRSQMIVPTAISLTSPNANRRRTLVLSPDLANCTPFSGVSKRSFSSTPIRRCLACYSFFASSTNRPAFVSPKCRHRTVPEESSRNSAIPETSRLSSPPLGTSRS